MLLSTMPLRGRDYWIVVVASMEQLIGGALATVIGIMLPMLQLTLHPELSPGVQGLVGAMGLIGIGIGSFVIGSLSDKQGYLLWFRICPIIMLVGCAITYFFPSVATLIIGLLLIGIGVGGGYSLDSAYISELLPDKWKHFMVGVAKATCSIGFVGAAVIGVIILHYYPEPRLWNHVILIIAALALITLLMRIRWWGSPKWLISQGKDQLAQEATKKFLGNDIQLDPSRMTCKVDAPGTKFKVSQNWSKIIFSGIPWACEGMAVYGFSVFLPVLVMALGIGHPGLVGIHKITHSVEISAVVNFFMIPGFVLALILLHKVNNIKMMYNGFFGSAIGLALLWVSYVCKWDDLMMILGFIIFELALNAGPHILTYIIPTKIYSVQQRAEGSGIAAMIGKVGAVSGVIFMPLLLSWGGINLVLGTSIAIMLIGALISAVYGKKLQLL